jgi:hypothetical protein
MKQSSVIIRTLVDLAGLALSFARNQIPVKAMNVIRNVIKAPLQRSALPLVSESPLAVNQQGTILHPHT